MCGSCGYREHVLHSDAVLGVCPTGCDPHAWGWSLVDPLVHLVTASPPGWYAEDELPGSDYWLT